MGGFKKTVIKGSLPAIPRSRHSYRETLVFINGVSFFMRNSLSSECRESAI